MTTPARMATRRHSLAAWILFTATVLLCLCSLLVFVSAPSDWLWIVAIIMTEWGHYAAILALVFAALSFRRGPIGRLTAVVAVITSGICLSPALRAALIARSLPARCTAAFGAAGESRERAPLRFTRVITGVRTSDVEMSEHDYAQNGRKTLKLDLYRSRTAHAPQPIVIMVHGGSWNGGDKKQLPAINRYLAREGYAVASINHRHAPKHPFPAAIEDLFRAIDFLRANATELRLDPTRIVLIGRSAGGQIALSAAYAHRDPAIRGVISFYAPTDLVLGYEKPSRRAVLDSKKVLEDYLRGTPAQNPEGYAAASPINFVSTATPPTLLIHGALDPIVWPIHSELLAARLRSANRPHLYLHLPWATHGCDANISGPSGQLSLYAIRRFLASVLAQ